MKDPLVGVTGFRGDGRVETPLGLFPDAVDEAGRFTDPGGWTLANGGEPSRWYMNISNRIILYRKRAYVATGISRIQDPRREWLLDPSVTVLNVEHPDAPEFLGNYPCTFRDPARDFISTGTGECLIVGSGNIVRRFDHRWRHFVRNRQALRFPTEILAMDIPGAPTIHDVCKTDLICDGLPVFFAGAQATDDLYLFTV